MKCCLNLCQIFDIIDDMLDMTVVQMSQMSAICCFSVTFDPFNARHMSHDYQIWNTSVPYLNSDKIKYHVEV